MPTRYPIHRRLMCEDLRNRIDVGDLCSAIVVVYGSNIVSKLKYDLDNMSPGIQFLAHA